MTPSPTDENDVLTLDELQLDDEHVDRLDENRYLVRSEQPGSDSGQTDAEKAVSETAANDSTAETDSPSGTGTDGREHIYHDLATEPELHGVDITLKLEGELTHHRTTSNDVREVFVKLLTWYADQLDDDLSPREALQIMLAASDLEG